MGRRITLIAASACSVLLGASLAAAQAPGVAGERAEDSRFALAPSAPAEADTDAVSDADIETFAEIYVALERTVEKYERQLANVESAEEAQRVQTRMQQESYDTVEAHGWTVDRFERIKTAVNSDPELVAKALELIEQKD